MQIQHTMNCQRGAGEQRIRQCLHRTPSHTCSAVLPGLSPALRKRTCSEGLHGRQAGRETPNAVVLDKIVEHETTDQGEPSRAGQ